HEVDYSLLDMAADARAATPTAACRILTQPISQLQDTLLSHNRALGRALSIRIMGYKSRVERLSLQLSAKSPQNEIKKNRQTLEFLIKSLVGAQTNRLERLATRAANNIDRLELVNPAQLLRRGYSITTGTDGILTSCVQLNAGDSIITRLADGEVVSTVTHIEKKETN
ncbi:MAG: exodeoxyribonuclease VII large subunit, partial [Angelakisella sp.]